MIEYYVVIKIMFTGNFNVIRKYIVKIARINKIRTGLWYNLNNIKC
jgi:hypothetical protein